MLLIFDSKSTILQAGEAALATDLITDHEVHPLQCLSGACSTDKNSCEWRIAIPASFMRLDQLSLAIMLLDIGSRIMQILEVALALCLHLLEADEDDLLEAD